MDEPNNEARLNIQAEAFNPLITSPMLQQQIKEMIEQAINTQGREIINSLISPESNILTDEAILPEYSNRMEELDRIPDVVRCLREFNGNSSEYSSWKKNVERILTLYENKKGTPKYFGILSVIRNKITGNADQVLESYNTPLNWQAISKCLNMHYADKRDIGTLEYQMTTLVQGSSPIEEFYQRVYAHLSLILNKISCAEFGKEATMLLTKTYREKALDTFIRGLNGQLPSLLSMKEPTDLPQALQLCQKLQNQNFRASHANKVHKNNNTNNFKTPRQLMHYQQQPQQARYQQQAQYQQQQIHNQQQPFYPQLAYMPRNNMARQQDNQPFGQIPNHDQFPREEQTPMSVDETMHTQRINYANRNAINNKRAASSNQSAPRKQQRTFNLNTTNIRNNNIEHGEELALELSNQNTMPYDINDINFLE